MCFSAGTARSSSRSVSPKKTGGMAKMMRERELGQVPAAKIDGKQELRKSRSHSKANKQRNSAASTTSTTSNSTTTLRQQQTTTTSRTNRQKTNRTDHQSPTKGKRKQQQRNQFSETSTNQMTPNQSVLL